MKKTTFLALILTTLPIYLSAQNILVSNLSWTADQVTDLKSNDDFAFQCVFKTDGDSIQWIQKGGSYTQNFNIQSSEGSWEDVQKFGEIKFRISYEGVDGTFVAKRNTAGISITIDFTQGNELGLRHRFRVNQISLN